MRSGCGAQKFNRRLRELGSLCEWAVAWATDRTGQGRAEEGSGKGERRVGRDVEHNNVERER